MNVDATRLTQATQSNFVDCGRQELEAFAEVLGVKFSPNIGDENLRARMVEHLGGKPVETIVEAGQARKPDEPEKQPAQKITVDDLMALNLTPQGKWQGRRHMVQIIRPENFKGHRPQPFNWAGYQVLVPWNKLISVPYPIYEQIKNAEHIHVETEMDSRHGTKPISESTMRMVNRWNFTDAGVDPTTAHLPRSQKQQFRWIAEMSGMWRDLIRPAGYYTTQGLPVEKDDDGQYVRPDGKVIDRSKVRTRTEADTQRDKRHLTRIARRLRLRYERGASAMDIRDVILRKLGYDVDLMDEAA